MLVFIAYLSLALAVGFGSMLLGWTFLYQTGLISDEKWAMYLGSWILAIFYTLLFDRICSSPILLSEPVNADKTPTPLERIHDAAADGLGGRSHVRSRHLYTRFRSNPIMS